MQAHAMTPHQGSGAGQGIEDAYVLGSLLAHPFVTLETLDTALGIYEKIRLPHANGVQQGSLRDSGLYTFTDPRTAHFLEPDGKRTRICSGEDIGQLWEIGHASITGLRWAWTTNVEDDRLKAMEMLKARLEH